MNEDSALVKRGGLEPTERRVGQASAIITIDLLEDIADSLAALREIREDERSEGEELAVNISATTRQEEQQFRHPVSRLQLHLHTITVYNDGPGDLYLRVNLPTASLITLKIRESLVADHAKSKKKITRVYHSSDSTASARIVGKY